MRPLSPRQYEVLQAVADGRIERDMLLRDFEPHRYQGTNVNWTLRALSLRGLIFFQPMGPPALTRRGHLVLNGAD